METQSRLPFNDTKNTKTRLVLPEKCESLALSEQSRYANGKCARFNVGKRNQPTHFEWQAEPTLIGYANAMQAATGTLRGSGK